MKKLEKYEFRKESSIKKLQIFEKNNIKDFSILKDLKNLQDAYFTGNPGTESSSIKTKVFQGECE